MTTIPQIIAHRGASYDAPENTLAAIRLCWEQRADAVEVDVHLTADGQVIVIHDAGLQRTTGYSGSVSQMQGREIRALDAGSWKGQGHAGERIPALSEVLETVPEGKIILVEIKCGPEIVPALRQVLETSNVPLEKVFLMSFDFHTLEAAKAALPDARALYLKGAKKVGQWTRQDLDRLVAQAREAGFDGLNLGLSWPVDQALVKRVHEAGLLLYVWTVNDAEAALRLAQSGVNGITTDRPGWIRDYLNRELRGAKGE